MKLSGSEVQSFNANISISSALSLVWTQQPMTSLNPAAPLSPLSQPKPAPDLTMARQLPHRQSFNAKIASGADLRS
jgi:hypothetical protein